MNDQIPLEQFPCLYTFKIIGRHGDAFVDRVSAVLGAHLGPLPRDEFKVRESAHGRYASLSIEVRVESRAQLEQIYADLRAEPEVLLYL